jgi:hypothetical protein
MVCACLHKNVADVQNNMKSKKSEQKKVDFSVLQEKSCKKAK